jgi:signal transduction histidine kinase
MNVDDHTVAAYGGVMPVNGETNLGEAPAVLRLPPDNRHTEFEFTAFNFSAPDNVHFRYRLEGFDDDWVDGDTLRAAIYPRLPAGEYEFRVAACNSDGAWNEARSAFVFSVAPFFWQTWYFRAGAFLVFTVLLIALIRYALIRRLQLKLRLLEQQAALDKERARIARDLHDDLGGSLTEMSLLLGLTGRELAAKHRTEGNLQQCSTLVQQMSRSVDEIIWAINPRNDTLRYLIDYMSQFVVEFLHAANVRCRVDLPNHIPDRTLSPEARHNLFLVVKEVLNNIARHSQATEVRLAVAVTEEGVNLTIEDNGQGFDAAPANGQADGLRNMRQRMEEIGGHFSIESMPETGTRVSFLYRFPAPFVAVSSP